MTSSSMSLRTPAARSDARRWSLPPAGAHGATPLRSPGGVWQAGSGSSLDPGRRQMLKTSVAAGAGPRAGNQDRDCALRRRPGRPAIDPRRRPAIRAGKDDRPRSPARSRRRAQGRMEEASCRRALEAAPAREQTDATIGTSHRRSGQSHPAFCSLSARHETASTLSGQDAVYQLAGRIQTGSTDPRPNALICSDDVCRADMTGMLLAVPRWAGAERAVQALVVD